MYMARTEATMAEWRRVRRLARRFSFCTRHRSAPTTSSLSPPTCVVFGRDRRSADAGAQTQAAR